MKSSKKRAKDKRGGMATMAGATIGLCDHSSKSSGVFPSDVFDFRRIQE